MSDTSRTPFAWRAAQPRGTASHASRSALGTAEDADVVPQHLPLLSFRDLAAIQIAAAVKSTSRELSPRETAEVAFELALALDEERARRQLRDREPEAPGQGTQPEGAGTG
jgi:hypothetical protein